MLITLIITINKVENFNILYILNHFIYFTEKFVRESNIVNSF